MSDIVLLPKRLRAPEVVAALKDIGRRVESDPVTIDFRDVEEFDSSTLALLSYVLDRLTNVTTVNIGGSLALSEESFVKRPPAAEPEGPPSG